jgi:hypothetical protein
MERIHLKSCKVETRGMGVPPMLATLELRKNFHSPNPLYSSTANMAEPAAPRERLLNFFTIQHFPRCSP